jgi:hypothetical protein
MSHIVKVLCRLSSFIGPPTPLCIISGINKHPGRITAVRGYLLGHKPFGYRPQRIIVDLKDQRC